MKLKRIPVDIIAVAAYNPRQDLGVDDPAYLALQQPRLFEEPSCA